MHRMQATPREAEFTPSVQAMVAIALNIAAKADFMGLTLMERADAHAMVGDEEGVFYRGAAPIMAEIAKQLEQLAADLQGFKCDR